jgi:hypothetical protein
MTTGFLEPLYETLRTWALHPTSVRPSGWAQMRGGGLARWIQTVQHTPVPTGPQITNVHAERPGPAELSRLLAAMIAEVGR